MAMAMAMRGKLHFLPVSQLSPWAQAGRTCRLKLKGLIHRPAGMA